MKREHIRKKRKKRRWIRVLGITFLVLLLAGGGYAFYIYKQLEGTVATMQGDFDRDKSDLREAEIKFSKKEPFSVLILGVDERKGDRGRSDSLIVLTVNPKKRSVDMVSIPRDTRTEIAGKGSKDKINHSYAYGGTEMTIKTVEKFLDIPIDYYIKINMAGFKDIVNALGGVTVENKFAFTSEKIYFPEGKITLNGKEALAYSRMRKKDPRGDYGRQERQRQVIKAIIDEGASVSSITKLDKLLGAIGNNVETNLSFNEIKAIQKHYKDARHNINQIQIKGEGTKIDGIFYIVISDEEKNEVKNELKSHLELNS